jgi:hypothetical protein
MSRSLRTCMYPHDVKAVMQIRLSGRIPQDYVAWFHEKSGLFTVRSAYHLAVRSDLGNGRIRTDEGSSSNADGRRSLYNEIWSAKVPQKVRIFAWRLSQDGLATQENRKRRTLVNSARCTICGREDESGFHARLRCTKARALRGEMRKHWLLPDESKLIYTGPDWLLILLGQLTNELKARFLLMLWRAWYLRNGVVHGHGTRTITGSAHFLVNYWETLQGLQTHYQVQPSVKGKEIADGSPYMAVPELARVGEPSPKKATWSPPPEGWAKINTDAGFCNHTTVQG